MSTKKQDAIATKISKLKALIKKGIENNFISEYDYEKSATNKYLLKIESKLKTKFPEEFRAFCLQISKTCSCPYSPVEKVFPEFKMSNMDCSGKIQLLREANDFEPPAKMFRSFPLTKVWEPILPNNIVKGNSLVTQLESIDEEVGYNRNMVIPPLVKGQSPFDGLYELESELHYTDSYYFGFYLVIRGKAKGQVWICFCAKDIFEENKIIFRPLSSNFLDWHISWLENSIF